MIFKKDGTSLKKITKNKIWWVKLAVCLILSNIFFFVLFKPSPADEIEESVQAGWVELQIRADLLTPYKHDKKILLINRISRSRAEGVLKSSVDSEGRMTVLVREIDASILLKYEHWEVLPYMKTLSFAPVPKGDIYEIRY